MPALQLAFRLTFSAQAMLPYRTQDPKVLDTRSFGDVLEPRYIIGTEPLDQ